MIGAPLLDPETWTTLPFHFWTVVFGILGAIVGSFLNVCIHRMPRDESIIRPPSHCPQCGARIGWRENLPILSWFLLRGKCAQCGVAIPSRYVLVELLTALVFATLWILHGEIGAPAVLMFCLFSAGLIVATFIDLEHLIIPDEITLGGTLVGIAGSVLVPAVHGQAYVLPALKASVLGAVVGAGVVFAILELGKLWLGRQRFRLEPGARLVFTESDLHLPDRVLPYEDVFYRMSDALVFHASRLEMVDRCHWNVPVELRLRAGELRIGDEVVSAGDIPWMEAVTDEVTVPREALGLGDVKFMAFIGAFAGWPGVLFTLMGSSIAGLLINVGLIAARRRDWSARIPYGPYLAAAALVWFLGGREWFMGLLKPPEV